VLFGGESFPPAALAAARRTLPHARFSNVYGPAEVNQCTFHHLEAAMHVTIDDAGTDSTVPIGRPWADTEVLLVDADDRVLEGATEGELLVSTDTMMDSYWGRPDLTSAAIGVRPETGSDGRWYRTGDLVRRLADGTLVFLGRSDHQVKVRGHRIELEAVESVVTEVPGVDACAVLVERGDDDRLIAMVTPEPDDDVRAAMLALLQRRLPRYSVPAEIVGVASLPRTGVGKVDRTAAAAMLDDVRNSIDHAVSRNEPHG
jgi:acyl-CoA synthetase (AMP-forming)/AMP-acid ligase II